MPDWFYFLPSFALGVYLLFRATRAPRGEFYAPPPGSPYRTPSGDTLRSRPSAPVFHVQDFDAHSRCPKCLRFQCDALIVCRGKLGECPTSREHFHFACRCGTRWISAVADAPKGGECS
jgi:hypothetical protein